MPKGPVKKNEINAIQNKSSLSEKESFLAAGEGFEPSQTESESGVLPLHKPAKRKSYYNSFSGFVNTFFQFFYFILQPAEKCSAASA